MSVELAKAALHDAAQWWSGKVHDSWVPSYLDERGLRIAALSHGAGWAPAGWNTTVQHLANLGYSDQTLLDAGLAVRASTGRIIDVFRDRMVLPIHHNGDLVGFLGRVNPADQDNQPKWVNSPSSPVYDKSAVLYGYSTEKIARGAMPVLVEGPLDVLALSTISHDVAIAPMAPCGTALTATQINTILGDLAPDQPIAVCFDGDDAGQRATLAAWVGFTGQLEQWQAPPLLRVPIPAQHDPADLVQLGQQTLLKQCLVRAEPLPSVVADLTIAQAGALDHVGRQLAVLRHFVGTDLAYVHRSNLGRYLLGLERKLDLLEHDTVLTEALEKISPTGTTDALSAKLGANREHPQPHNTTRLTETPLTSNTQPASRQRTPER